MMFTSGYWERGAVGGVPLRWHWSVLLGMALAGGLEVRPLSWLLYLGLVQMHLMAHAWSIRRAGLVPIGVDVQGIGGKVRWNGVANVPVQVRNAWVGVLAQAAMMALARVVIATQGGLTAAWLVELEHVWVHVNAVMIAVCLLPLPTFDGEVAWKVFALWRGEHIRQRRVFLVEVAERDEPRVDEAKLRSEVDRELAAITRAHNDRAETH